MSKIVFTKNKLLSFTSRIASWYLKYYLLGRGSPLIATFQLTHLCNLKCKMCNLWRDPQKKTLGLDTYKSAIRDLNKMGCCYVSLSGGEPLLIKEIISYVQCATDNIPFVNLVTNGFLLDKEVAVRLAETGLDTISISIDGLEKTHDEIRGTTGAFQKAIEAIDNLKASAPKIKITVNTVISPWNIAEIINLAKFIEELKVLHKFQPIYHHPVFKNQTGQDTEWQMDDGNLKDLQEVINYLTNRKNVSNSRYYLAAIPRYFSGGNKRGLFAENCKSGSFYCEIKDDGLLFPCIEGMSWQGGFSLLEMGLCETYYSPEYKRAASGLGGCKRCQEILPLCYLESRIAFPITSFIKYSLIPQFFKTR